MTRCKIPEFCEKNKTDIGIYDLNSKKLLPRSGEQREVFVHIHKNHYCDIWKKIRRVGLLNGVEETGKIFEYIESKMNENNLKESLRYRFAKHEGIDH